MKRIFSLFSVAAMVLSLAACGKQDAVETEPAKIGTKTTYTGTVSAVSTDSLTVSTEDGEVTVILTDVTTFQREMGGMSEMPGDMGGMPNGGETPPDKPEGNGGQGDPMDKPDEEMGNQPNGTPPEMPNGQQPGEGDAPEKPDGMNDMGMNMPGITVADISVGDTVTVETDGESSAAIRSDRGSGTMVVDGGSYTSNGVGSPAIYSAADITVNNAQLTATGSEAICIEGLNTIRLFDCDLSGNMLDLSQNDCTWNVILYQSMSGDSEIGNSTFEMVGGSLTAGNGGMFYTTNTESTFLLSNVDINYSNDSEFFLKCTGNANQRSWVKSGDNGADCHFTARNQAMVGNVIWDSISQLDFYVLEDSTLTGAIHQDEPHAGNGGVGYCNVYLDATSTWTVTSDSRVSNLFCEGKILDTDGNTVAIVGTDGTIYVEGTGVYTVTVDTYSDTADVSGASALDHWDDYSVEKI